MTMRNWTRVGSNYASALALVVVLTFLEMPTATAQADESARFGLSVGLFVTDRDSSTQLDPQGSSMAGTEVDLEGELGLDTSDSVFRLDGYYRFNPKHRIDFSWFDLSRTGSKPIQRDIEWNDTLFPLDTVVDSDFDGSLYDIYAGVDNQITKHMAVGLGINSVRMDIGVTKPNATGNMDWRYDGGLVFFEVSF